MENIKALDLAAADDSNCNIEEMDFPIFIL
jgi:hypothetical protein